MERYKLNGKYDLMLPAHRIKAWRAWGGYWEVKRIESMLSNIQPGDVVIDIGAEEGDISALLAQVVHGENMILFEPGPDVWPNIKATWDGNKLETPKDCYVGFASDVTDENPPGLDYSKEMRDGWPQCAYGAITEDYGFRHIQDWTPQTSQITLDDYCNRTDTIPDMITMDVEGAEFKVLLGAEEVLREHHPLVYVSIHPDLVKVMYNMEYQGIHNFMRELGYKGKCLAVDHEEHWFFMPI